MKKFLSIVLCIAMVLSTMGTVAFAEEATSETVTPCYTDANSFWGEAKTNSTESLVIEIYEDETKIASASLNNVDGIIDGDVFVTWHINFGENNDEYWDVEWAEGYPKYDMNPTAVKLLADGVEVAQNDVRFNGPDDLNKIVAIAEGFTGGVKAYTSLEEAIGKFNGRKVNVVRDVNESIDGFYGCTLTTNVEGGVTVTNTYDEYYVYANDFNIGKGVTVKANDFFYERDGVNTVDGTLEVTETLYHGYDAKTTVNNGGKIAVGGTTILRYNKTADAGLYIYGDGDDSTVEFDCDYYIGAYSGTFYAENANIEAGYYLLKNSYDNETYADIDLTLDNSSIKVVGTTDGQDSFIIDDKASVTLKNGSAIEDVRDFNILAGTDLTLDMDGESSIKATNVSVAKDVPFKRVENGDGTIGVVEILPVEVTTYEQLLEAIDSDALTIIMMNDIVAKAKPLSNAYGSTGINILNGETLDGKGHTLTLSGLNGTWDSAINITGGTIKNLTVNSGFRGIFINHNSDYSAPVILENVIIDGPVYTINCDQGTNKGLTATNCTFNGWTSFAATLGKATFNNCKFGEGSGYAFCRPFPAAEFNSCEFEKGYEFDASQPADNSLAFNECKYDGEELSTGAGIEMFYNGGNITIDGEEAKFVASPVAQIGLTFYTTVQAAVDAAKDGDTVKIISDCAENIVVTQKADVDVTIDGCGNTYTGQIEIYGQARNNGAETLTIKNINFDGSEKTANHDFITCNTTESAKRYAHNVTIENCNFVGNLDVDVVAARFRQCYNINFKDCTFKDLHSAMWATGGGAVTFDDVEIANCKGGISTGTNSNVVVKNSTISTIDEYGYGIRTDASGNYSLNIENCTINSDIPVLARKATGPGYSITVKGSTLNAKLDNGIVLTKNDYDSAESVIVAPVDGMTIDVDKDYGISAQYNAKIGKKCYSTLKAALDAVKAEQLENPVIELLADDEIEATSWDTLAMGSENTKSITINGATKATRSFGDKVVLSIKLLDSDWSHVTTVNDAKLILNNVHIKPTGYNSGHWKRIGVHFNCPVELNNVTSDRLLGFKDDATLNYVTINNELEDNYALWIHANGQNIAIDHLTITSVANGRGIKIADEDAQVAKVNLEVTNSTFQTNKKAAILVTSTAGAAITASNNNISQVKADSVNLVWKDEARAESDVTLNGEQVITESSVASDISIHFEKISNGVYNIVAKANNGDINELVSAQFTFKNLSKLIDGAEMKYTIAGTNQFDATLDQTDVDQDNAGEDEQLGQDEYEKYAFNANTATKAVSVKLGEKIILGTITFDGFGTADFVIDADADNFIKTTKVDTNNEDTYVVNGVKNLVIDTAKINEAVAAPMRDVQINIDFKNDLSGVKDAFYNDMTVVVENAQLGYKRTIRIGAASADEAAEADIYVANYTADKATIELKGDDAVFAGYQYTVTLTGAGYRTYRYVTTIDESDDKLVLTFWNNAKFESGDVDPFIPVEKGGKEIRTTFLAGDISMDNIIDKYDLAAVVSYFGTYNLSASNNPQYAKYDLNRDGKIDAEDIAYVLYSFGY